jgi:hypothetical protein
MDLKAARTEDSEVMSRLIGTTVVEGEMDLMEASVEVRDEVLRAVIMIVEAEALARDSAMAYNNLSISTDITKHDFTDDGFAAIFE